MRKTIKTDLGGVRAIFSIFFVKSARDLTVISMYHNDPYLIASVSYYIQYSPCGIWGAGRAPTPPRHRFSWPPHGSHGPLSSSKVGVSFILSLCGFRIILTQNSAQRARRLPFVEPPSLDEQVGRPRRETAREREAEELSGGASISPHFVNPHFQYDRHRVVYDNMHYALTCHH